MPKSGHQMSHFPHRAPPLAQRPRSPSMHRCMLLALAAAPPTMQLLIALCLLPRSVRPGPVLSGPLDVVVEEVLEEEEDILGDLLPLGMECLDWALFDYGPTAHCLE
ncbi:unnamed protein product [Merluccius merluccius]